MSCCKSAEATVDYETDKSSAYMYQVEKAYKEFTANITQTEKAFQQLLSALDHSGQTYANMAQASGDPNKDPIIEFRDGMRDIKESGPYVTFNNELHQGTIATFDAPKKDLDELRKGHKKLSEKKKKYDSLRAKCESIEASYAKKDKPLAGDSTYQKTTAKRDQAKDDYELSRDTFTRDAEALKERVNKALHTSLNNYLQTSATLCGYLETSLNGYRTNVRSTTSRSTDMEKLKEKAKKESAVRSSRLNPSTDYPENAKPLISSDEKSANPLMPKNSKKKKSETDISTSYPREDEPKPLVASFKQDPKK